LTIPPKTATPRSRVLRYNKWSKEGSWFTRLILKSKSSPYSKDQRQALRPLTSAAKYGMSDATFYKWKSKYAGLTVSELKRLKSLEDENRRLKQIVAQQALDNWALKELLSKNF
jgi:hypothetical protein